MHSDDYKQTSAILRTRLERLLRERELRKSFRSQHEGLDSIIGNGQIGTDTFTHEEELGKRPAPIRQRLLVVANRLPVRATRKGESSWQLEMSIGGLVSALLEDTPDKGITEFETRWIGWAGVNVPDEIGQKSLTEALAEKRCIPVFLDEDLVNLYYNGYCNNILWPLFHYIGLPQEDRLATTRSFQSQFDAYVRANQMFADVVNEHYIEGDIVWCHDYHLMFLPKFLKEHNSTMKVGWFLHTPFPSSEIHRTLPSRSELLRAVLVADLVGFHTYDYARHFVSACTRILGLEGTPDGVEDQGKLTRVAAFPIGIDPGRFIRAIQLPQVKDHIEELKKRFSGRKIMLGVDRLDMIKGIPQKILAFEKFLEENPDWHDKVVLLQIAAPTRTNVLEWAAQSLGAGAILVNPWNITEVASSIAYALNMPAEEREKRHHHNFMHVTTHTSQEWAETFVSHGYYTPYGKKVSGASIFFESLSYKVDPVSGIVDYEKLEERVVDFRPKILICGGSSYPREWDYGKFRQIADKCGAVLMCDMAQISGLIAAKGFYATLTEPLDCGRRVDQFKEMEPKLHPEVKEALKRLCEDPKTTVVVLSGCHHSVLDKNFGEFNIWLGAEHGVFLRTPNKKWIRNLPEVQIDWVDSVKHVFEYFTERTPRSTFELRETSLVWNFKHADIEFGRLQAKDMLQHLWTGPISNASVEVVQGGRSVEVRANGVTKGSGIKRILGEVVHYKDMKEPIDYVLCVGHFLTKDEDVYTFFEPEPPTPLRSSLSSPVNGSSLDRSGSGGMSMKRANPFSASNSNDSSTGDVDWKDSTPSILDLNSNHYFSCAVKKKRSCARYLLSSSADVVSLLKQMADN
ncbi:alpha,alpha-trehalose-phosphate synthase [Artemisia annua]|uniref:alpha,alpha-trehalose-phosphate synthase (UDP-forming) n=1 Tax=Artemisia annua TaxID=35608 RepID=A0A2U1P6B9_ARTAN|nr:alpha,alpha-trehalose-phosphate synthase [Artemisia annua]